MDGGVVHHVVAQVGELVHHLLHVVSCHETNPLNLSCSDSERLRVLESQGLFLLQGCTWNANNCLPDSLLQCMMAHRLLAPPDGPSFLFRQAACADFRAHCCSGSVPVLVPRNVQGCVDQTAYMQHHRHAEAAVRFFLERFSGSVGVPVEGICLHVHARYDTAASPADEVLIAHRVGSSQGPPLHFHLFCSTGSGSSGYH